MIDIWQTEPQESEGGRLVFTGGSLEPFEGQGGELLAIRFKAVKARPAFFVFETASAYLADGQGTRANSKFQNVAVSIEEGAPLVLETPPPDNVPPEIASFAFTPDPVNQNQKLLSFIVKDEGSGVKAVEIRSRRLLLWSSWENAESPVLVPQNIWSVGIRLTDNSGNMRERILYEWPVFFRNTLPFTLGIIAVLFFIIVHNIKKRRKML